jgi:hypothetical protein
MIWERLDNNKASRIKYELLGVNVFNEDDWSKMIAFMIQYVPKFESAFRKPIQELKQKVGQ